MADTHDNLKAVEKAVKTFNAEKVEKVLHAGDLVSPFVVDKLRKLEAELYFVWGNNEGDRLHSKEKLEDIGVDPKEFLSLEIDGLRVALLHGTSEKLVEALTKSENFDAVVRGHTHEPRIKKDPLMINPGATSGYLSDNKTVAILDTEKKEAEILEI